MKRGDLSEPVKSCMWLKFWRSTVPLGFLTSPMSSSSRISNVKIESIEMEFDLYIVKDKESKIRVAVFKYPLKPNENPDDGYALRFYFTISGFDEQTQSAIMKYEHSQAGAFFMLTEDVLKKARSTHVVFDVFVVVQMLEFKSLDKNDSRKIGVDKYISHVKKRFKTKKKIKQLGCILKNPKLEDVFTGRLSELNISSVIHSIVKISEHLDKLADYFKAKYADKDFEAPDFEVNKLFNYLGMSDEEGPVPLSKALHCYRVAHSIGLDCFKTAASSYLKYILDEGYNVMHIVAVALAVYDKDLIDVAMPCFLDRLTEITCSEQFKKFSDREPFTARLIVHSAQVWIKKRDDDTPGSSQTAQLTTEL